MTLSKNYLQIRRNEITNCFTTDGAKLLRLDARLLQGTREIAQATREIAPRLCAKLLRLHARLLQGTREIAQATREIAPRYAQNCSGYTQDCSKVRAKLPRLRAKLLGQGQTHLPHPTSPACVPRVIFAAGAIFRFTVDDQRKTETAVTRLNTNRKRKDMYFH